MILVDTSVWINHLRLRDSLLAQLLDTAMVLVHPFVIGEIALGHLRQRGRILDELQNLPLATVADETEVLDFIGEHRLFGYGIGYVDAHLLAAVRLTPAASLWTHDKRLFDAARHLKVAADLPV